MYGRQIGDFFLKLKVVFVEVLGYRAGSGLTRQ